MTIEQMIAAAMQLASLYQGFADRAKGMTEEQAKVEWSKVNARVTAARANWEASKG